MYIDFISVTCFGSVYTIIKKNYFASYLKSDGVIKLLNIFSTVRTAVTL